MILLRRKQKKNTIKHIIGYKEHITRIPFMNHTEEHKTLIPIYE